MTDRPAPRWIGIVLPLAVLAAMQAWSAGPGSRSESLASPLEVLTAFGAAMADGSILQATAETFAAALGGLAIGSVAGIAAGVVLGLSRPVDRLMLIPVEILRPVPVVALIPVGMLIFGLGYAMEITLVAIATTWPMLLLTRAAILGVEPRLMEVAHVLRMGFMDRVRKIVLPAVLPRIALAFRLSIGIALIVAVTVEIAANPLGLGYGMMRAVQSLRPEIMLAFLGWLAFVGWALNAILERLFRGRHGGPTEGAR